MSENHKDDLKDASNGRDVAKDLEDNPGIAGRLARAFINSPLSPLLFMAMLFIGLLGLAITPRQEDPQISVPMVDIMVQYQGASSEQVSSLAIEPLERLISEIPGVEHIYSASQRGKGIVTVQFTVGEEMGPSIVKVHDKIQSNIDRIPPGVSPPLIKPKGIDDVPAVNLTLWSNDLDDGSLRILAMDVLQRIEAIPDTGFGFIVGGRSDQVRIEVFPQRLSGYGISLDQVANTIRTANSEKQAGNIESSDVYFNVYTGSFLRTPGDIERLVVGTKNNVPVYVRDVAKVTQQPEDANQLVEYYTAPAGNDKEVALGVPAITIAIAKKEGTNGVAVADAIISRVKELQDQESGIIPANVHVSVTRDYGFTADQKVRELLGKLFKATGFVFILVLFAFRAFKPALVVLLIIPVVILFTIFCAWLMGYTIDRVSLFALIFSIGILVDDAIVVVENIYRRWLEKGKTDALTAVDAVREVGNPTIIATFTVIAALLPMGFVRGMMGPYMEPIPALGSVAMLVSLIAAFIFTPWWAMRLKPSMKYLRSAEKREHAEAQKLDKVYRRILVPLISSRRKALVFKLVLWGLMILSLFMFYTTSVTVKMLPLDNKPEFSVVINMPEGTALPATANLARRIAEKIRDAVPHVIALQTYVATAKPFDFNGMVRHYYLRDKPWQAEVQVQLLDKNEREESSHELAVMARELIQQMAAQERANIQIVEMPPGPPVLQTIVADVYGPSDQARKEFAHELTRLFKEAENISDVDNYMEEPYYYWRFEVDTEKAVRKGISVDTINRNVAMAMGNYMLGDIKVGRVLEPTHIVIQTPLSLRSQVSRLNDLPIPTPTGTTIPLGELGRFIKVAEDSTIMHKDLRPVEYVTGESTGRLAAPVYGMSQVEKLMAEKGYDVQTYWTEAPKTDTQVGFEWAGEWTVTYETFRDMGLAFAAALIFIYVLVVWEFGNFRIPALIMAPIPLTLLGIIPGHWLLGAEFTATSMIGWIALAGIIVRNSILLVDFSLHSIRAGKSVEEAVVNACTTRTRPIIITALALVLGASVIISDPIFSGMAISLAFGVMVSTVLTLVVIPIGCIAARDSLEELALIHGSSGGSFDPDAGASESDYVADATPAQPSVLSATGDRISGVFSMAFYMLQGLVTLIWFTFVGILRRFTRKSVEQVETPQEMKKKEIQKTDQRKESLEKSAEKQKKASVKKAAAKKKVAKKAAKTKAVAKKGVKKKVAVESLKTESVTKKPVKQSESSGVPSALESTATATMLDDSQSKVVPTKKKTQLKKKIHVKQTEPVNKTTTPPVPTEKIASKTVVKSETKNVSTTAQGTNGKKVRPEPVKKETESIVAPKRPQLRKRRGIRLKTDVQGLNDRQH